MKNRDMMNIHINALAHAAGVPANNIAVSHAPDYPKPAKHHLRRATSNLLRIVAQLSENIANRLESKNKFQHSQFS